MTAQQDPKDIQPLYIGPKRRSIKPRPIWEEIEEIANAIPETVLNEMSKHDGSTNYRHYLYGHPKRVVE